MRLLSIIALLPTMAIAADVSFAPKDLPIIYSMIGEDVKYRTAAFKAQEALFMQIGLTQHFNALNDVMTRRADSEVRLAISKYTPLNPQDVLAAAAVSYTLLIKREFAQRFRNPLFRPMVHVLKVSENTQSLNLEIPMDIFYGVSR